MDIGPNFGNELIAAGLGGLPVSWTPDGIVEYGPAITEEQKTAIEAVLASHDHSRPEPHLAYRTLIAAGCQVVSSGTPALSGVYAIDDQHRSDLQGLVLDALVTGAFPTGATFPYADLGGTTHPVTPAQLQALGAALAGYVVQAKAALAASLAGGVWAPPAQPVMIA